MKTLAELTPREQFIVTRWFYSIGQPIITDAQYTLLLKACTEANPDDEYVKRSWSSDPCPVELLKEMGREDAIVAVIASDRTESIPSLNSWSEVTSHLHSFDGVGTISYKHDGWNVQAHYYNGDLLRVNTRGRSSDFMDVSALKSLIPQHINAKGRVRVVMECTIPNSKWPEVKAKYNNTSQRASVSTILANPQDIQYLQLHAFDIHGVSVDNKFNYLQFLGFETPEYRTVNNWEEIQNAIFDMSDEVEDYNAPTDGLVFDGGFKFALRVEAWEEKLYKSFVTGYEESYNRYVISPKLKIYPIQRQGATQRLIPITNWKRIIELGLKVDSPIAFSIVSDAIADIDEYATRLLQQEYEGNYEVYKHEIITSNSADGHTEME